MMTERGHYHGRWCLQISLKSCLMPIGIRWTILIHAANALRLRKKVVFSLFVKGNLEETFNFTGTPLHLLHCFLSSMKLTTGN